jgi:RimJ/RimL family protein N-acetyltransferase
MIEYQQGAATMRLRDVTPEDYPLWVAMQCDPLMMAELGGPQPLENMPRIFQNNLRSSQEGSAWIYVVLSDEEPEQPAGSVVVWEAGHGDESYNEMGWMILPAFQGKGLASRAVRATLDKARAEGRWGVIHTFPVVTNGPSNGVCRKTGFTLLGEVDFEYSGRPLRCNHWVIDLTKEPDS